MLFKDDDDDIGTLRVISDSAALVRMELRLVYNVSERITVSFNDFGVFEEVHN